MKKSKADTKRPIKLRKRTEELLNKNPAVIKKIPPGDLCNLLEDMQIYQIELEKYNNELQKIHEDLRESEERFRNLTEITSDWIWEVDKNGFYTYVSPKIQDILGYEPEEIIGKTPFDLMPPAEANRVSKFFNSIVASRKTFDCLENLNLHKNGHPVVLETSGIPTFDADGEFIGYRGIDRDITERKRAEEFLRKQTHDLNERVKELNCLYGISKVIERPDITFEEMLQEIVDLIPPSWQYPEITCARIIIEGQEYKTKNFKETVWKQTSNIVVHGGRVGILEICYIEEKPERDEGPFLKEERSLISAIAERLGRTTEHKQAQEALRESEKFSYNLLNNSPHPILVINKDTSIRYVNPALETLTGFSSEELIDRKAPYPWWTEETMQKITEDFKKAMSNGAQKVEELFQKKDGDLFWVEITSVPIRKNEAFKYYLANWVDITDRKQAEKALRENEGKLNAMLQSIKDHISMMDKDLNIIWTNKTAEDIFGKNIIGKKCYEVYHQRKEPCEPYPCITLKAFRDGKVHKHDTQVVDQFGKKIFFHCTANVALRDKEGNPTAVIELSRDITEQKQAELALIERGKELETKTHELEEVNAALKVLLKHRDKDQQDFEEKIVANVKKLVLPYVEKLNNTRLSSRQAVYLDIVKSNLEDIITPFLQKLSSKYFNLTPREVQIAGLVKDGKTTKEIAKLLNNSIGTVEFHRNNLRKKLGLRNTKTNLRSFLSGLS